MTNVFDHLESTLECESVSASSADKKGRLVTAAAALAFIRAGKSTFTLVSVKTGTRFTYRVTAAKEGDSFFVGLLNGPDNNSDYAYAGRISRGIFWAGRKAPRPGDVSAEAPSSKAFDWTWRQLVRGQLPDSVEVWHEDRCGRCGLKLTVPASVSAGYGPECRGKMLG